MRKLIKSINLESTYMNPAEFRFYTTEMIPNGTSTLIITDDMNQIIGHVDDALFDPPQSHDRCGDMLGGAHICIDSDSIITTDDRDELFNDDSGISFDDVVYPLSFNDVLESIAVSPMQSHLSVLKEIVSIIKKAA